MRPTAFRILAGAMLAAASCTTASIDVGYLGLELGGDIGFARGAQNVSGQASVDRGLGQGGTTGAPYGRVELASDSGLVGGGVFASGFLYDNQGSGILTASYGNISAGTAVASDFRIINAKVGVFLSFDIAGVLYIRPGIAADMFLPDMTVSTTQITPTMTETIDDPGGVPLPYLQVGIDTGVVGGFVEVGYLPLDTEDLNLSSDYEVESTTLDIEAMLRVRPAPHIELFAGYRLFALELEGRLEDDSVDIDIDLSGFMIGGGVHW
jgi:hypothetical protein